MQRTLAARLLALGKPASTELGADDARRIEEAMRECVAFRGGDVATGARAAA